MRFIFVLSLLFSVAHAQQAAGVPMLSLDGKALENPHAVYDPRGVVEIGGSIDNQARAWRIRIPRLQALKAGRYGVGSAERGVVVREHVGDKWLVMDGAHLEVSACGRILVRGSLEFAGEGTDAHRLEFALKPRIARVEPSVVSGARDVAAFPQPADQARAADLVFCAVGNTGTGLPGAKMVVQQMSKLSGTGPLDFMLLLGGTFLPNGVTSVNDRQWSSKFEELFSVEQFGVPCYSALAPCERDHVKVMIDYGKFNMRWAMPNYNHHFEVASHGKRFLFVGADTVGIVGDLADARSRNGIRQVRRALVTSDADWKIVFGHDVMFTGGPRRRGPGARLLRERLRQVITQSSVDLFIGAAEHVTELITPHGTTVYVTAGGGGGPEMADPVVWNPNTRYAFTGGGFAWFRFNGVELEISLRDAAGKVRYVHTLRKQ